MNEHLQKTIEAVKRNKNFSFDESGPKIKTNESVGQAAYYYEKLRNAIEYADEHLFLKNAIKRILKRRTYLGAQGNGTALLKELIWAKYFQNDTLPLTLAEEIESILRKYSYFRESSRTNLSKTTQTDLFVGFAACEIEELLSPAEDKEEFLKFAEDIFAKKIPVSNDFQTKVQIEISIRKFILREDFEQVRFKLIRHFLPSWPKVPKNEGQEIAQSFGAFLDQVDSQLNFSKSSKINKYVKKNSPAFNIIYESIYKGGSNFERNLKTRDGFCALMRAEINRKSENIRSRVFRAVIRGIIFILLTKIVLAFIIEIPYELHVFGQMNKTALITNITLPPLLMMIIGLLIKVPGKKNAENLVSLASGIVFDQEFKVKDLSLAASSAGHKLAIFNFIYSILSIGVLVLVIWLLIYLKFNIVSIFLFYTFVSLVSFLGFRIRSKAREIEVSPEEDTIISGLYNFILLPFVVIGKFLSDRWSEYNITLVFWDFVIEAPLKAIIGLFEAWLAFSREKREEFE